MTEATPNFELPAFDHLAIAARTLDEGAAWIEERLGIAPEPGGAHPQLATHNRLLSLGPGEYLEIIAADPAGGTPLWPRWFGLDTFTGPPRLVSWVVRSAGALTQSGTTARDLSRGALRWRFSLPDDGQPLAQGVIPALIDWQGSPHPSTRLTDHGLRLNALELSFPDPLALPLADPRIRLTQGPARLQARLATPRGEVLL
ncbi:VOC family protein [Paracoccus aminophilus]|uniref:Glyoxalase-like domain-containing protein n=1 Tax=Paracoccus aminophilus JCM 7686 TaxID=1367847 RepID=S5Y064_PARAH|nr:VOC family protein [Paracoccus aminophilus]AGT09080.1 hypothetical protein JCM7686_1979 [Paracoccus aminophilus JCM 7686]